MKMSYEEFKNRVQEEILNYLPEEYQDYNVEVSAVTKTNCYKDSLMIFRSTLDGKPAQCPIIYLKDFYDDLYQKNDMPFEAVMHIIAVKYEEFCDKIDKTFDAREMKKENGPEHLYCSILDPKSNKKLLEDVPYEIHYGLAVICRWAVRKGSTDVGSIVVNNHIMEEILGMDKESLFNMAKEGTKKLYPVAIESMCDIILKALQSRGVSAEIADSMSRSMGRDLYVVRSGCKNHSAVNMIFDDVLQHVADTLKDNYYVLPINIHSLIIVIDNGSYKTDPTFADGLKQSLKTSGYFGTDPEEFLCGDVYYYDHVSRSLIMASSKE